MRNDLAKPKITDLLSMQAMTFPDRGPMLDQIYDPQSPDYRPDLIPEDDAGTPLFTEDELPTTIKTGSDLAKDDWVTTKLENWMYRQMMPEDPNFEHPWDQVKDPKYFPYSEQLGDTNSKQEWDFVKKLIDQKAYNDDMMSRMSLKDQAAYFGTTMLDPVLMPLYFVTLPFSLVGKGAVGARAIASAAGRTAAYTAVEAAAIEGALQATDPLRTAGESIGTIVAAGVMGSVFGAAGQGVMRAFKRKDDLANEIDSIVKDQLKVNLKADQPSTVGARSTLTTLEDEELLRNPTKAFTLRTPTLRLLQDKVSRAARYYTDLLVPHNMLKKKHLEGKAPEELPLYSAIMQTREKHVANIITSVAKAKRALRNRGIRMSQQEIAVEVGKAARRGDSHAIPEIEELAGQFRAVADEMGERARKVGLLSEEELTNIDSYFPRLYDTSKIARHFDKWETLIVRHFERQHGIEPEYGRYIASEIQNQLNHVPINQMHLGHFNIPSKGKPGKSGHFKGRRIDLSEIDRIVDNELGELSLEDFLIDDVRYVMNHYLRSISPGVIAREMFGVDNVVYSGSDEAAEFFKDDPMQLQDGVPVIISIFREMQDDYTRAKAGMKNTRKLQKQWEKARADMLYLQSSIFGYGNPKMRYGDIADVASHELRAYTAAAQLGAMVVAAIPDMANLILNHGLRNLIKSMPAILLPRKMTGSAKADFDAFAIGLDTVLSTRMLRFADLEDKAWNAFASKGAGGSTVANFAFKAFGANLWNSYMKRAAAVASQNRLLADVANYSRLGKWRKAKLAQLGVDENWAKRFADSHAAQTQRKRQGVNWADVRNWDDTEAAARFERILFRDIETTIVTPQVGDMPRILDNSVGLMIAQFKRFVMAHQFQIMGQAGQRLAGGDLSVLNYIAAIAGLGLISEYTRLVVRDGVEGANEAWKDYTPTDLIFKSFDRSAGLSFGTDLIMGIDSITQNSLTNTLGMSVQAKATNFRPDLEQRIPSIGWATRHGAALKGVGAAAGIEGLQFTKTDLHRIRGMIPLQNTFYLAWLFNQLEQDIALSAELPDKTNARHLKRY